MQNEGSVAFDARRYGLLAGLRHKQWWSFEGLDADQKLYFVFLALEAFPTSYVSFKVFDYKNQVRWTEDHLGGFTAAAGSRVGVEARGAWGHLRFSGCAEEGWSIDIQTPHVVASFTQQFQAPLHRNWLLTQTIDYTIQQFISNRCQGKLALNGQDYSFDGFGYHEHNWGVQPRHSTTRWLHFWGDQIAGVVLSCTYDAGTPHAYTFIWQDGQEHALYAPAEFSYTPDAPDVPWQVISPDLNLTIHPVANYHTRMTIPPLLAYIDVDYYEQLLEVEGTAFIHGIPLSIRGTGKFDFNWNRW